VTTPSTESWERHGPGGAIHCPCGKKAVIISDDLVAYCAAPSKINPVEIRGSFTLRCRRCEQYLEVALLPASIYLHSSPYAA